MASNFKYDVIVIGGGASGMMAAGRAVWRHVSTKKVGERIVIKK